MSSPKKGKPKYSQVVLIGLIVLGFETFSFFKVNFFADSPEISIWYRFFFVVVCMVVIKKYWYSAKAISTGPNLIVLAFWVLYFIKGLYDTFIAYKGIEMGITEFWLFAALLCFLPMLALVTKINDGTLDKSKKFLFILALIVNFLGLTYNLGSVNVNVQARFNGNEILNSVSYGQAGLVLIILCLSYLLGRQPRYKALYILLIVVGLANIALAASRGPIMALGCCLGFYSFTSNRKSFFKLFVILLFLFLIALYFKDYLFIFDSVIQRIVATTEMDELRYTLFQESWDIFIRNPLFGGSAIDEYAHNIFLASLSSLGIMGGILMAMIYRNALKGCYVMIQNRSTDWIALIVLMQLFIALVSGAIWNNYVFWPFVVLISNLYHHRALYSRDSKTD